MLKRKILVCRRSGGCWQLPAAQAGVGKEWTEDTEAPGQGPPHCFAGRLEKRLEPGCHGRGPCEKRLWLVGHSQGGCFTTASPLTRFRSLLGSGSSAPAEHHHPQLLPRPVLFTPLPGAESQVGKVLRMPSWVITISPSARACFWGPPWPCHSSATGDGVPRGPDRDRHLQGGFQLSM